ncbi:hypothetical protein [Wocania ichthyoenteri]|uniref:hypothetical protein n=1 Tax=Wocania ichthyoenteri TaxID=1230531 RepID=UPI00053D8856|nr:hypothetical protein [Wocania ichthyoenteri]
MKKSNSIKLFITDLEDILETAINISLFKFINPSLFKNSNIQTNSQEDLTYEKIKKFNDKNLIYNHLLVNVISIMESYLHNILVEHIKKDSSKSIKFVEEFNFQKSLSPKHVIEGPESLTINTLEDVIYHNLPKVNTLFKIIFEMDILNISNIDIKTIFLIIKVRHSIVHDSNRVKEKKFYISSHTFIDYLDLIANWLMEIDSLIMTNHTRKRKTNYYLKFNKELNKYTDTPLIEQGSFQLMRDVFSDKNKTYDEKKEFKL